MINEGKTTMLIDRNAATLLVVDVQDKLLPAIAGHQALLARLVWLTAACRDLALPTVISEQYPNGLGRTVATLAAQAPAATVVEKLHFSCVAAGCLPPALAARQQWIVCGIEAHVCVLQTALELIGQGKQVFVVADAVGSRRDSDRDLALARLAAAGAAIVSREMVLFELLRTAGTDAFRAASRTYLQGEQP